MARANGGAVKYGPATMAIAAWIERNIGGALDNVVTMTPAGSTYVGADMIEWGEGKLFELFVFLQLLKRLRLADPACKLIAKRVVKGEFIYNGAPGRANPKRSHVAITLSNKRQLTAWQSVEFIGLSASGAAGAGKLKGDYHEADILIVDQPAPKRKDEPYRPKATDILLVAECKFMPEINKEILRNMLGLRREMSYLSHGRPSPFKSTTSDLAWALPATRGEDSTEASHLLLAYTFAPKTNHIAGQWARPGDRFGIEYWKL